MLRMERVLPARKNSIFNETLTRSLLSLIQDYKYNVMYNVMYNIKI